ncbi:MAG TPA: energy transducer TonB [Spirosoma sp.]|jgi:TonB family protein|nr:energy transducer TonB [Spirosoma sp.]
MYTHSIAKITRPVTVIFRTNWLLFVLLLSSCLTSRAQAITDPQPMALTTTHSGQIIPVKPLTQQADEFSPVNNTPFFPGGPQALQTYLQNPALYPLPDRLALREGNARVQFRVTAMGQLTQLQVVQSGGTLIDQAALRVVAGMPRWYPAHRDGAAVSCLYELPITFRLD